MFSGKSECLNTSCCSVILFFVFYISFFLHPTCQCAWKRGLPKRVAKTGTCTVTESVSVSEEEREEEKARERKARETGKKSEVTV